MVQPMRPVSEEVARPVNAPNYPAMYSESIRAALMPAQYLLDLQKELSEEDVRKGQIQNWLSEADQKHQDLNELTRSHLAEEANQTLSRGLEGRRIDEETRHNTADETHSTAMEGLEGRRLDIETRGQDLADKRAEAAEQERATADKATQAYQQGELDIRKSTQESELQKNLAVIDQYKTNTEALKTEAQQKQDDEATLREAHSWVSQQKPEDIFSSADNPQVQDKLNEFFDRVHTTEGTRRLEAIVGSKTAVGQEVVDRKELNGFSPEARRTFQENMLKSSGAKDANGNLIPTQLRFNDSLRAARNVDTMEKERGGWDASSVQTYKQALASGQSENEAQSAGRLAQGRQQSQLAAKDQKVDPKLLEFVQKAVPQRPGENDGDYAARSGQEALDVVNLWQGPNADPAALTKKLSELQQQSQGKTGGAGSWIQKRFGIKPKPGQAAPPADQSSDQSSDQGSTFRDSGSMVSPGQGGPKPMTIQPGMVARPSQLAMNTSPIAPAEQAPDYQSSTDNGQLDEAFSTLFGSKADQASSTLPIA
jgi:hypothetical protein